ncbi:hypothetical protein [Sporosarcina sp. FSL K6-3457]|uniref:hypothetical protein n=1 Tax=Sporosarcina sp. FSL K6-3457 TaxID=2978204 RepID=UPI0030F777BC
MLLKKSSNSGEKNGVSYLNVYSYVVEDVVIDTGSQSLHTHLGPIIDAADFEQVMITHFHEDHTGLCSLY